MAKPRGSDPVKKPRQHHVWQQYLRAWSVGGEVYCLQGDRIFRTGTPVLGMATDFYKLRPLTEGDLKLLKFLLALDKVHPIARKHHEMVLQNILIPMVFVQQNRDKLNNLSPVDDLLDTHNTNAVDNQHTVIERVLRLYSRAHWEETLAGTRTTRTASASATSSALSKCEHGA
jgi:hypothetical protein